MIITVSLMIASSAMLNLPWPKVLFFSFAIGLMSASLAGLAVGLGALFPNFKEDNPSKIVSGFGGTLCLVISFIYITLFRRAGGAAGSSPGKDSVAAAGCRRAWIGGFHQPLPAFSSRFISRAERCEI
jgi:ABC-2 type transport system permease protein